jgi:hypothetical protein
MEYKDEIAAAPRTKMRQSCIIAHLVCQKYATELYGGMSVLKSSKIQFILTDRNTT